MWSGSILRYAYRHRVGLFLLFAFVILPLLVVVFEAGVTLRQLGVIERERDGWQRPADVLKALAVKKDDTVADLGCGSGYFALKLSSSVGPRGRVLGVDIRRESLMFLWMRSLALPVRNVSVIHGRPDDPMLGVGRLDAALISNTYHELTNPASILHHTYELMRRGGRLVVLDRGPDSSNETRGVQMTHHELPLSVVEKEITRAGFEIVDRQERFIERFGDSPWWLAVAVKR